MRDAIKQVRGKEIISARIGIWFDDEKHITEDSSYLQSPDLFMGKDHIDLQLTFQLQVGDSASYWFGMQSGIDCGIWQEEVDQELPFSEFHHHASHLAAGHESGDYEDSAEFVNDHRVFNLCGSLFEWLIGTKIVSAEMIRWKDSPAHPVGVVIHFSNGKMLMICGWGGDEYDMLSSYSKPTWIEWEEILEPL